MKYLVIIIIIVFIFISVYYIVKLSRHNNKLNKHIGEIENITENSYDCDITTGGPSQPWSVPFKTKDSEQCKYYNKLYVQCQNSINNLNKNDYWQDKTRCGGCEMPGCIINLYGVEGCELQNILGPSWGAMCPSTCMHDICPPPQLM